MDELKEHPQTAELLDVLEKNGMNREKAEVEALADYICGMEKALTRLLDEIREMREEIDLIHNGTLRAKCHSLVQKTENKIRQGISLAAKVRDNLVRSVKNALTAFKENGKEVLRGAVKAMKIPETLDMLGKTFGKLSKEIGQEAERINEIKAEFSGAKRHLRNAGALLIFRNKRDVEGSVEDKGTVSRLGKLFNKIAKGLGELSQKALDKADGIRVSHVRESVRNELKALKGMKNERANYDPFRDRGQG